MRKVDYQVGRLSSCVHKRRGHGPGWPCLPGRQTFDPERRIRKKKDFIACYQKGSKFYSQNFILFVLVRPGRVQSRLGLAVSRKIGKAVQRNRIKRVLREFFRLNQSVFPAGVDLVIVPKRGLQLSAVSLHKISAELLPALDYAFRKLGLT